jgi:hypothetical protein
MNVLKSITGKSIKYEVMLKLFAVKGNYVSTQSLKEISDKLNIL